MPAVSLSVRVFGVQRHVDQDPAPAGAVILPVERHCLAKAPVGVMAEAISETGGSYTTYNSISTFSGMPTVLGWVGHEAQWRGGYEEIGNRQADIRELYSTGKWERAQAIIDMYNIRYIVVGNTERNTYKMDQSKFDAHLVKVFDSQTVDIYEVKP